ncbi:DUF4291 domain-containing protein [Mesorhizobium retamae]|uniref:DUF4291 domain-containing protein n=1 Tax=Mesorhizobium retamae TaxID=2912854 RepID=A0ABS9QPJ9_9HYPH|nr:DUF4291 domain-containing protein [Mesorhizobium sp. IRAMC:0171]MCG7509250.1 DUF4291 domain-containing protein [Mesorhizobium sp. IRAMC:0171]
MIHQIRAVYDETTIRVYQAYNDAIADAALKHGTFVSPPFSLTRMSWIKPSFLWMMYRSGWGKKDPNQKRILAIEIKRTGFESALSNSCLSHFEPGLYGTKEEWKKRLLQSDVRIQWDPERDLHMQPLSARSLQVGLSGDALRQYVDDWIISISDISDYADLVKNTLDNGQVEDVSRLLPKEKIYNLPAEIEVGICASSAKI